MTLWRLLITSPARGAWKMELDKSILEHIGRGESIPTLRLYASTPACLSLGHAQPFADVDMARHWPVNHMARGFSSAIYATFDSVPGRRRLSAFR